MKFVAIDGTNIVNLITHATTAYLEGMMSEDDPFYEICEALESGESVLVDLDSNVFTLNPSDLWD